MRVGVDLDGVCYSFDDAVKQSLVTHRGWHPDKCPPSTSWEFYEDWGLSLDEFLDAVSEGINAGLIFETGEPYEGTKKALQRIVDAGHDLHVITARGLGNPGIVEGATARWVKTHLPKVKSLTFSRDKTIVPTDMMIDDNLDNYDQLEAAGCYVWLYDQPWNQVPGDDRRRVTSMEEFAEIVILRSWTTA
jgi:hypothetical protein